MFKVWNVLLLLLGSTALILANDCKSAGSFGKCICSNDHLTRSVNILCIGIPFTEIKTAFDANDEIQDINSFITTPAPGSQQIPADLLGDKRVRSITIASCGADTLNIDRDAFRSSADSLIEFSIVECDVGTWNWSFLNGFNQLNVLLLDVATRIQTLAFLPSLPGLKHLSVTACSELEQFTLHFPNSSLAGLISLNLENNSELTDTLVDSFLLTISEAIDLEILSLKNNPEINRVPKTLAKLQSLNSLDMSGCKALISVANDSLSFSVPAVTWVDISDTSLVSISDNAFERGFYGEAKVNLDNNYLDTFPSTVYLKVLNEMFQMSVTSGVLPGSISIQNNPIKCDSCDIAWLIRDFKQFLPFVSGTCANSTQFQDLNPEWYSDQSCTVVTTTTLPTTRFTRTTTEQNTTEQNTTEQNTTEQNTTEQNTTEQNTTEQNTVEQNTTQQTTTEQNTTEPMTTATTTLSNNSTTSIANSTLPTETPATSTGTTATSTGTTGINTQPTANPGSSTTLSPSSSNDKTLLWVLSGILVIIVLVLICGLSFWCYRSRRAKKRKQLLNDSSSNVSRRNSFDSRKAQSRSTPLVLDPSQLQSGRNYRGPAATIGYMPTNRYPPDPTGRVRGLRRTNF